MGKKFNSVPSSDMAAMQCYMPFYDQKVLIGLSGGINSMAILCWLKENKIEVGELHLYYAHFKEHSPDTFKFVADGIRFAKKHFDNVKVKITRNSVIEYFENLNMIPHPMNSPCSKNLKIIPIMEYCFQNGIKYDLVGYVKHELKRRGEKQQNKVSKGLFDAEKVYPIGKFTDEWCFEIVDRNIGWHPAIYDIKDENGKRIFKHNNCLPCKNMNPKDYAAVKKYYPAFYQEGFDLSERLKKYWGRKEDDFYFSFDNRELGQPSTCEFCVW